MDGQIIATVAVAIPVLGFLWTIHRDVSGLRERMARMEGLIEGFATQTASASGKNRASDPSYQIREPQGSGG